MRLQRINDKFQAKYDDGGEKFTQLERNGKVLWTDLIQVLTDALLNDADVIRPSNNFSLERSGGFMGFGENTTYWFDDKSGEFPQQIPKSSYDDGQRAYNAAHNTFIRAWSKSENKAIKMVDAVAKQLIDVCKGITQENMIAAGKCHHYNEEMKNIACFRFLSNTYNLDLREVIKNHSDNANKLAQSNKKKPLHERSQTTEEAKIVEEFNARNATGDLGRRGISAEEWTKRFSDKEPQ